jgi:D-arabinose 1-dehydrogenase-like Zn-dependent alcohol dehydrogenase
LRALYLLLIYLTTPQTGSISTPQNSINQFRGTWVYETEAYNFQITFFEDTEGKLKSYSSVAAQNGNFLDTGEMESPNIEIGTFNKVTKELQIIINSTYSEASFKASLKLIDGEKIEFKLGESIDDDVHYFPLKPTILTKQ